MRLIVISVLQRVCNEKGEEVSMKTPSFVLIGLALAALAAVPVAEGEVYNGSFETGDLSEWVTTDLTAPDIPLHVGTAGEDPGYGFFLSAPTDGTYAALHGFGGGTSGTIMLAQDFVVIDQPFLAFDYRAAWDLSAGAQDRLFRMRLQTNGGGGTYLTEELLTAPGGSTVYDTGPLSALIDVSPWMSGLFRRISFEWIIPEASTGPAYFQLDNVRLIPEPGMVSLLGLAGLLVLGRRRSA
jgi:hypothetical protein